MKTHSAKAKGRKFQQWVRDQIIKTFPELTSDDVRSTSMGASGDDILLSSHAIRLFPYSVECKARHAIAVYAWLDQLTDRSDSPVGLDSGIERDVVHNDIKRSPIVFAKGNHREPIVIMYAEDFLKLFKEPNE